MHFGIDYGSKLAGTTAICFEKSKQLYVLQSIKKKDADTFVRQQINDLKPTHVFLDAPLSLPQIYVQPNKDNTTPDFFFRSCDKSLRAMSPMFLGGLTARAMKLSYQYLNSNVLFFETYPSFLVKTLFPETIIYKKKTVEIKSFIELLQPSLPFQLGTLPTNWHQVDAILAWLSGHRFLQGIAQQVGEKSEGIIIV